MDEGKLMMRNRARQMRAEMTPAEKHLWQAIRHDQCDGLRFRRQCVKGPYITDFYCPSLRMVIEVDGGIHNEAEQREHDESRTEILKEERGFHIFRLTNTEVLSSQPEELRQKVLVFAHPLRTEQPKK
jgi:very-short-patch-repair endonuclease